MTTCSVLKESQFISKDNVHEAIPSTRERTSGTVVTLTCMGGLTLVGPSTVTCQSDGQWDYTFKPHCTLTPVTEAPSEVSDNQKIIIGVTSGVGALLILSIIAMMAAICWKDRKQKKMKKEYEDRLHEMDRYPGPTSPDSIPDYDGPSTIDREYGPRVMGAALPYDNSKYPRNSPYNSRSAYSSNGYRDENASRDRRRERDYRGYSNERSRDNGRDNRMYLPDRVPEYSNTRDRVPEYSNNRNKPYVDRWVNKGLGNEREESFNEVPWVHGRGRNHLWRNA